MTACAFTGQPASAGQGLLDEGKIMSPVQLLLDREIAQGVQHLGRGFDPTPENIALETMLEVGVGLGTHYMETEHSARHFRSCLWIPELMDRSGWRGFEEEREVLDRTQQKVNGLLAQYEKPEGREEQLAAMRAVADRAKRELL